jgi:hypothetical protein
MGGNEDIGVTSVIIGSPVGFVGELILGFLRVKT